MWIEVTLRPSDPIMRTSFLISVLLALGVFQVTSAGAQAPAVEVAIVALDPPSGYDLAPGRKLSARIQYKSDVPVRFRMEGRWHDKPATASMLNPMPAYPAGEGEAVAWIAYRGPASLDEIAIKVLDEKWQSISAVKMPVLIDWREGAPSRPVAQWASELSAQQQDMLTDTWSSRDTESSRGFDLFLIMPAAMLAYFLLQPLAITRFEGRWRMAAYAPLVVTVPLVLHALVALIAGSNLWPLLLIFCLPFATLYLVALMGARAIVRGT